MEVAQVVRARIIENYVSIRGRSRIAIVDLKLRLNVE